MLIYLHIYILIFHPNLIFRYFYVIYVDMFIKSNQEFEHHLNFVNN